MIIRSNRGKKEARRKVGNINKPEEQCSTEINATTNKVSNLNKQVIIE